MSRQPPSASSLRAVIYTRTRGPDLNELHRRSQEETCRDAAERAGLTVVASYHDDGPSGLVPMKPGLAHLIELISADQVDVVLFTNLDRLTRHWKDMHVLINLRRTHGVEFVSCSDGDGPGLDDTVEFLAEVLGTTPASPRPKRRRPPPRAR